MKWIEFIKDWIVENPSLYSVFKYILLVSFVLVFIEQTWQFLRKKVMDTGPQYKSQKSIDTMGYIILVFLCFSYSMDNIKDFTLAIGLFIIGIAFTLQQLVLSITSVMYIFIVNVHKPQVIAL
ncbi:hypothetical protein N9B67_01020 [Algibacter sp.]|nr:hypothetical protein [Algibacter sp.]MDA9069234.1 hypothetical protein [Algibacter sp.]MDA9774877.1 hypothetical protein [Algibacter sp.]MDC1379290.1 hypothetical protein [Algibacter sp.]